MATQYANGKIVINGLTVLFDAADKNSYPGSGTTWYDMSGNGYHGTLTNGPTFDTTNGGSIVFDGTNDYVTFAPDYSGPNIQTVCFWGRIDAGVPGLAALVANSVGGDNCLRITNTGISFYDTGNGNDFQFGYSSRFMINGIDGLSSSGGIYTVPNGRTLTQDYFVGAIGGGLNLSTISHTFNGRVYKGRVYKVALYNRQLTSSELLQNYNATKSRFNL